MRSSPYILQVIKSFEGFEPTPKPDPGRGVLTVGYGHTRTAANYRGQRISRETAERLFLSDIAETERKIEAFEKTNNIRLTVPQFDALVSFVFNVGNIPQSIQQRIIATAGPPVATSIKKYTRSGNQTLPGLVQRRKFESMRFNQTKKLFWLSTILLFLFVRNR